MSLDYNLGNIKNWEDVTKVTLDKDDKFHGLKKGDKIMNPVTQSIIFGCIPVGIGDIENENEAKEWWIRYELWCRVMKLENNITIQDVINHIGLSTNVFPRQSDAKWAKNIMETAIKDVKWQMRNALKVSDTPVNATIGEPENLS